MRQLRKSEPRPDSRSTSAPKPEAEARLLGQRRFTEQSVASLEVVVVLWRQELEPVSQRPDGPARPVVTSDDFGAVPEADKLRRAVVRSIGVMKARALEGPKLPDGVVHVLCVKDIKVRQEPEVSDG